MKDFIFLLIFCVGFQQQSQAQVPGYQGKRFFIEAGCHFFARYSDLNASNQGSNTYPDGNPAPYIVPLRAAFDLSAGFIFSWRGIIKISNTYAANGIFGSYSTIGHYSFISGGTQFPFLDRKTDVKQFTQLHSHNFKFTFNLNVRKSGHLAPLGLYWELGFNLVYCFAQVKEEFAVNNFSSSTGVIMSSWDAIDNFDQHQVFPGQTVAIGFRQIFAKRMTINIKLEHTLLYETFSLISTPQWLSDTYKGQFRRKSLGQVQLAYLLNLHISIGVLI